MKRFYSVMMIYLIVLSFVVVSVKLTRAYDGRYAGGGSFRYILDAGHGIPDGGAVGVDGTTEQELNLKLVLKIQEGLVQKNISALLTREDQNGIYTEGKSIHDQKISDIKNRVKLLSQYSEIPVISIHMNSFTDPSVHGIQVFYKDGDSPSMELAKKLQERINAVIQPENTKGIKRIPSNVYLFSHIPNASVLLECGFVSNREELEKLKDDAYLQDISEVITEVLAANC